MKNDNNLVWLDLEMTGLDPEKEVIIEIATIVTDPFLNILAEGPVIAIHQPESFLSEMDSWNTRQHGQSGLVTRVRESMIDTANAEKQTLDFLSQYVDAKKSPLCGNSICQDRRFLYRYMPQLAEFLHYRNLDVTTIKELVKRWKPDLLKGFEKVSKHLALDDVKDSIDELRYYREHFIINLEP